LSYLISAACFNLAPGSLIIFYFALSTVVYIFALIIFLLVDDIKNKLIKGDQTQFLEPKHMLKLLHKIGLNEEARKLKGGVLLGRINVCENYYQA